MYELLLKSIKRKWLFLFVLSFLSVIFSAILSRNATTSGGYLVITLSLIPLVQVMTKLIELEEIKEEHFENNLFIRHKSFIINYFSIFLGAALAFYITAILYPYLYVQQVKEIIEIKNIFYSSNFLSNKDFWVIFNNNLRVLVLSFLLSFIFGAGAIFIIIWNASILGVFLYLVASQHNGSFLFKYILVPLYSLLKISVHGIPEFLSYFLSALAGGILSISFIKPLRKKVLIHILKDSVIMFVISVIILFFAALLEVYI